jgi:hypothetical protein
LRIEHPIPLISDIDQLDEIGSLGIAVVWEIQESHEIALKKVGL